MKDIGLIMKEMQKHMNLIRGRFLEVFDERNLPYSKRTWMEDSGL